MKIACLGWGSLIWRPESLLIHRQWFEDGPFLSVEYARQSNDGRLTLVITDQAKPIRTLWALMATDNLETAKDSLRVREGILKDNLNIHISSVRLDEETTDPIKLIIKAWAAILNIDAVIWTSLPPKFKGIERVLTEEEAINYLQSLEINIRQTAEEYVRKTPQQVDTQFRRKFEAQFGWVYIL